MPNRAAESRSSTKPSRKFRTRRRKPEQLLAHHSGALERLEKSEQALLEESLQYREGSQAADLRWQAATERARFLDRSVADAQQRLANYRRDQAEMASRCDALRDSLAAVRARRHALGQVLSDRSYSTETVQKLFASNGHGEARNFRAVGLLADYAEVEPQYETAVEQFLRDELEYVVVETFDHARAGIALLREEFGGPRHLLRRFPAQLGSPRSRSSSFRFPRNPAYLASIAWSNFAIRSGLAAKQFLPRLRSAFLVEAPEAAERLARENPSYIFLTTGRNLLSRPRGHGRPADRSRSVGDQTRVACAGS